MVEVTIQQAQVSVETCEDRVVLRVLDDKFRWNIVLTEQAVTDLMSELELRKVAA